jgi:hypothetical protein
MITPALLRNGLLKQAALFGSNLLVFFRAGGRNIWGICASYG